MASHLFVDNYLRGRRICAKEPLERSEEELVLLREWLLERSKFFKTITKDGFHEVCKHVSLKVIGKDQLVYHQEDVVESFYVILRGSVSLMVDPQFHGRQVQVVATTTQSVENNQAHTNTGGKRKSVGGLPSRVLGIPDEAKFSLGGEVASLGVGDYFGQEALLQVNDLALFSAITTEITELLMIDERIFNEHFLSYFEKDLYRKSLYLASLDLFSNWSPYLLRQLAISVKEITIRNGDCILRQNMPLSRVLLLRSGAVKLSVGNESKPPQELLGLIKPPVDYLSEILAVSSPKKIYKSQTRTSSASTSCTRRSSLSATSQAPLSQLKLSPRPSISAPPQRRKLSCQKFVENRRPLMGFRLKEPKPHSTCQLCCLGQGEMLNHIEAICKIKHSLFNAVSLSDTVVYSIDTFTFMQLLERKATQTLLLLTEQVSERVRLWLSRNPRIVLFKPLLKVLQQSIAQLAMESGRAKQRSRTHSAEKRAYAAVKTLGKNLTPGFQEISIRCETVHSTCSTPKLSTETMAKKRFVIRRLTSTGETHDSFLYVKKECTSFDSPLPRRKYSPLYNFELRIPSKSSSSANGSFKGSFQDDEQLPEHLFSRCDSHDVVSDNVKELTVKSPQSSDLSPVNYTSELSSYRDLELDYNRCASDQLCAFDIESCATFSVDDLGTPRSNLEQYIGLSPWDTDDPLEGENSTRKLDPRMQIFNQRRCTSAPESHMHMPRKTVSSIKKTTGIVLLSQKPTQHEEMRDLASRRTKHPVPVPRPPVNLTPTTRPYYT